jgi:nicotinate-nucleotide adenylyltransferase
MTRLGLLGGTFDPIHQGHLDVAEAARLALGLTSILVVPSHIPPHRRPPRASASHRFAMAALAVQPHAALVVSDMEMEDAAPSYTAATLDRLARRGVDTTGLFFITGADAFQDIGTWMDYPAILDRCHFVAVSRPGRPSADLPLLLPDLSARMCQTPCGVPGSPAIFLVDAPTAPVSSTEIRERIRAGQVIDGMVPPGVAAYISKHGLYA